MPRRKTATAKKARGTAPAAVCVNLDTVDMYLYYIYFYKANAMAIVAAGTDLGPQIDRESFVNSYNAYISAARGKSKVEELAPADFDDCSEALSSEELVEMKEYLKSSVHPYRYKTSQTFRTVKAFAKLAKAADSLMSVRIGNERYTAVIEPLPRQITLRKAMSEVNKEFFKRARGRDATYTELFILANSLLAVHVDDCNTPSRLVLIKGGYYTSQPLSVAPLCREKEFARFYVELFDAKSGYTEHVASSLLKYIQTGDAGALYEIVRNMTQTKRLTPREQSALAGLLARIK